MDGDKKASLKGYWIFLKNHRDEIRMSLPVGSPGYCVCEVVVKRWRTLSSEDKRNYILKSCVQNDAGA